MRASGSFGSPRIPRFATVLGPFWPRQLPRKTPRTLIRRCSLWLGLQGTGVDQARQVRPHGLALGAGLVVQQFVFIALATLAPVREQVFQRGQTLQVDARLGVR